MPVVVWDVLEKGAGDRGGAFHDRCAGELAVPDPLDRPEKFLCHPARSSLRLPQEALEVLVQSARETEVRRDAGVVVDRHPWTTKITGGARVPRPFYRP
jgi:hypothetical protein